MTLMGTWITGYWDQNGLKPGEDYDFFEFPKMKDGVPNAAVGPVDGLVTAVNAKNPENARKLLSWLISDAGVQAKWATVQGALSANINVPVSTYSSVMSHALDVVKAADAFAFNYDLATPPPVAEVGLNMFQKFVNDQSNIDSLLDETAEGRRGRLQELDELLSARGHGRALGPPVLRIHNQPRTSGNAPGPWKDGRPSGGSCCWRRR